MKNDPAQPGDPQTVTGESLNDDEMKSLSLKRAYAFGANHGLEREVNEIRDMVIEWDSSYTSSLRRGYIVALFEERGIFEEFKTEHWSFGNSLQGAAKRKAYLRRKARYEEFLAGRSDAPAPEDPESEDDPADVQFPLEAHLRDFLARNLERIEPGLRLYASGTQTGVEFPVESGRIDLLAVDQAGRFLVIELKLSQGRTRTLGQLLYYMGWVDQHLGNGPCRGLIIAGEITEELCLAVARVPGVQVAKYRMTFAIEPVGKA